MRFPAALWGRLGADPFGGSSHFGRGFNVFKKVGAKSRTFSNGRSRTRPQHCPPDLNQMLSLPRKRESRLGNTNSDLAWIPAFAGMTKNDSAQSGNARCAAPRLISVSSPRRCNGDRFWNDFDQYPKQPGGCPEIVCRTLISLMN